MDESGSPDGRVVSVHEPSVAEAGSASRELERGPLALVVVVDGCPIGDLPDGACLRLGATALARLILHAGPGARVTRGESGGLAEDGTGDPVPAEILEPGVVNPGDPVRLEAVAVPLADVLDLHSFRPEETAAVLAEYLHAARQAGLGEVRIVHGRGRGVQRAIVRRVLAETPDVTRFADAPPTRGGWGATVVQLGHTEPAPQA
jgi:hypothetical protein